METILQAQKAKKLALKINPSGAMKSGPSEEELNARLSLDLLQKLSHER